MEWSGDLQQKVSVPTGAGNSLEQPVNGWIAETAPLSGTTEERKQQWKARERPCDGAAGRSDGFSTQQLWGNTGVPYALVAGVLNTLLSSVNAMHVTSIDLRQTMTLAWS